MRWDKSIKSKAIAYRKEGLLYPEINKELGLSVSKSTMYEWFKDLNVTDAANKRMELARHAALKRAQARSTEVRAKTRSENLAKLEKSLSHLSKKLDEHEIKKIVLGSLYLAEGGKRSNGSVLFGNSDPGIIKLFLSLFREAYELDESRFRCTVQARADQNFIELEHFWSEQTDIPLKQFYATRFDPRSVGKITKKQDYKGVCRINYFSASLLSELLLIGRILTRARSSAG